jgi:hypothetical protein
MRRSLGGVKREGGAVNPGGQRTLTDLTREAFAELRAALVTLG